MLNKLASQCCPGPVNLLYPGIGQTLVMETVEKLVMGLMLDRSYSGLRLLVEDNFLDFSIANL